MKLYQRIIAGGLVVAGLAGLFGCRDNSNQESQRNKPTSSHFASVPMLYDSGMSMTSGDFDGDGDLDLIVGAYNSGDAKLHFLRNQNGTFSNPSHFASVPMLYDSGMSMTSGDFDGDGDLDLIVGAYNSGDAKVYRFNNDGEGNFSQ